jgi:hypothetical protein
MIVPYRASACHRLLHLRPVTVSRSTAYGTALSRRLQPCHLCDEGLRSHLKRRRAAGVLWGHGGYLTCEPHCTRGPWRLAQGPRRLRGLTWDNARRSRPRFVHRPRHTPAPCGTCLHIREDPGLSVSAGDGVFGHLMLGAPGRIRTCAHGSGGTLPGKRTRRSWVCCRQVR